MIPRNCHVKHNPPQSYGDCIRACLATMLNRDDVPHLYDGRPFDIFWRDLRLWLQVMAGKTISLFMTENHAEYMRELNPDIAYLLLCNSMSGDHAIVCRNGERIHDPAWYRAAEYKPHSIGCYVIGIIGDAV